MSESIVVIEGATFELVEKKSKFIATIIPANSEEEANRFIEMTKKKYWDAKHNCTAFNIGPNNELMRCSDDGEPSGTAGRPMLEILTKNDLHNVCVVVTRYFGGILLGTGGLVRAYQGAVKGCLENCKLGRLITGMKLELNYEYSDTTKIQNYLQETKAAIEGTDYGEKVTTNLCVACNEADKLLNDLIELTNGKLVVKKGDICEYVEPCVID